MPESIRESAKSHASSERQSNAAPEQGTMSNRVFMAWIRSAAETRLGRAAPELDKAGLFLAILTECGPAALFEVGLSLKNLPSNAVLETILLGKTPASVLSRWARLERFSHTQNRTRVIAERHSEERQETLLEHYALSGAAIHPSNHLFIWGALSALLERAGFSGLVARVNSEAGQPLYQAGKVTPMPSMPQGASRCYFECTPSREISEQVEPIRKPEGKLSSLVESMIRTDLAHAWKIEHVAVRLRSSTRRLQRELHAEQTSFTELLHTTRIAKSRDLLSEQRLTLTEIAFCLGYSDLAHYSRVARRHLHVAPSEFRELTKPLAP